MNSKRTANPFTVAIIIVALLTVALLAIFSALFILIPVAIAGAGIVFLYRYWRLEKLKSKDYLPTTIKERPDYLEPKKLYEAIEIDRCLLNDPEGETGKYSCQALAATFHYVVWQLYAQEFFHEPPMQPDTSDRITLARYHDQLEAWQRKVSDSNNFELFMELLVQCYMSMREHFPPYALQETLEPVKANLSTPLQISNEAELVSKLLGAFFDADFKRRKLFVDLREQIEKNAEEAPDEATLATYFAQTPFRAFTKVDIPVPLNDETRFAGMWVCAPQGMGKTTLLHSMIATDLEKDASLILCDSKGEFIQPFLDHPSLAKRRVIIGPDDPIGLNPLDIPKGDVNKAVDNLEYLFSSLLDFKLTATQSMLLKAVFRTLIETVENPTLEDFIRLLGRDGEKHYARNIAKLSPDLQSFFATESYNGQNIRERKLEVLQRLRALLDHDVMRRMLMAPKTTFRIGEAMDQGAIVIINNSRGKLGNKGAEFLGRFFIAQVLAAAQERSFRVEQDKKPVYFYIDEAHTVVADDERITDVYHECRSQKIALCCAHQETTQVSEKVLSAFQNCAIRFAHPDEEARRMAISLRMEPRRLQTLKRGQFGAYIRGIARQGIVVNVLKPDLADLRPSLQPYRPKQLPPSAVPPQSGSHERNSEPLPATSPVASVPSPAIRSEAPTKPETPDAAAEWPTE